MTMIFLIIALAMSPFFLKRKDTVGNKVIYFVLSVVLTPLVGPFIYKLLSGPATTNKDHNQFVCGDADL